jgi:VWFA-related protein
MILFDGAPKQSDLQGVTPCKWPRRSVCQGMHSGAGGRLAVLGMAFVLAVPAIWAQGSGQGQSQAPANTQQTQDIPDAPSAVQPPVPRLPQPTDRAPDPAGQKPAALPLEPGQSSSADTAPPDAEKPTPPPPMPPVETVPPGSVPAADDNQGGAQGEPYKFTALVNHVDIPVMVKNKQGQRVEGLLSKDFVVKENGVPQKLTYFTSDPFALSVAIVLNTSLPDVTLQQVNETFSALTAAFSPYDEFALYTYSSTVSQLTDFTYRPERLTAALDELKLVRGRNNGPPVLGGPLSNQPPMVNGLPVGGPATVPVNTPPIESRVLNDAILRAGLDLIKRERMDKTRQTRHKVILVISDGQERGSTAGYKEVLRLLQTFGIQVKAVVVGQSALPAYRQVDKIHHLLWQGYSNILPKYTNATGGGEPYFGLTRNSIEDAYSSITADARDMYTLGYNAPAVKGSSAYRTIEVLVDKKGLNIYTKAGYYPLPPAHPSTAR